MTRPILNNPYSKKMKQAVREARKQLFLDFLAKSQLVAQVRSPGCYKVYADNTRYIVCFPASLKIADANNKNIVISMSVEQFFIDIIDAIDVIQSTLEVEYV